MLSHIRNAQLIRQYSGPPYKGWVILEDGNRVSPPVLGTYGNDKIVPVVEETIDTSTGPDTVRTDTGWQVEADRVYQLTTIRDMTPQEIADRTAAEIEQEAQTLDEQRALKALATASWHIAKGTVPTQALASPLNYRQWLKTLM